MATVTEATGTVQVHTMLFSAAVKQVSALAQAKLPASLHGRVQRATALVLAGGVHVEEDGCTTLVRCTHGWYAVNGKCPCPDARKAPDGYCKHRLARAIYRRAGELMREAPAQVAASVQDTPAQPEAPTVPLPEAPVSITLKAMLHGHEVLVTLRGVDFASVRSQVEAASDWLKACTPAQPASQGEGWCSTHGVAMRQTTKHGQSWWSHKTAQGWCKGGR